MTQGFDERCAADLGNVVEGRQLGREETAWLTRAVTGAVRPNRDKPLWDLAHLLAALAQVAGSQAGICDLVLDPRLAHANALARRFAETALPPMVQRDERGIILTGLARDWRTTWGGAVRLLALAEFLLTAEDLAHFHEINSWLDELAQGPLTQAGVDLLVKRLVRLAAAYRNAHLPIAPVERNFRAILRYLHTEKRSERAGAFDDEDIVLFWRQEIVAGERSQFRTVAEHFLTYYQLTAELQGLEGLRQATSLDASEDWVDRLEAAAQEAVATAGDAERLADVLMNFPETPKILTGTERGDLIDILGLEPFHRVRPLTVLRSISFGRVQSGIANRLRRNSGGSDVAERVACADAIDYAAILARAEALEAHVARMTRIAAATRLASARHASPALEKAVRAAEADLAHIRRAGFADGPELRDAFAFVAEALVRLSEEIPAFRKACGKAISDEAMTARFAGDRATFAATFRDLYLGKEEAHDSARTLAG